MKKIINSKVFLVIITTLVVSTASIYATNTYNSNSILYETSDGENISVNDALNDLYENGGSLNINETTELFSYIGQTSSGVAASYLTKTYTYTETDISNNYKYLIFSVSSAGARDLMYDQVSSISIPKGSALFTNSTSGNYTSTRSYVYIIDASKLTKDEQVFSIYFRGLFVIKLIGIK